MKIMITRIVIVIVEVVRNSPESVTLVARQAIKLINVGTTTKMHTFVLNGRKTKVKLD